MKSAFIFPGQGSQSVGMLSAAADAWPMIAETFDDASKVLGYDLWHVCQHGPAEELNQTMVTQPSLLTASVALWRQWLVTGGAKPDFVAGHSLGEYSAMVAAESLELIEPVKLVKDRGELMKDADTARESKMAAIFGLADVDVVEDSEVSVQGVVVAAESFIAPGEVMVACSVAAVVRETKAGNSRR